MDDDEEEHREFLSFLADMIGDEDESTDRGLSIEEIQAENEAVERKILQMHKDSLDLQIERERRAWHQNTDWIISQMITEMKKTPDKDDREELVNLILNVHEQRANWDRVRDLIDPNKTNFTHPLPDPQLPGGDAEDGINGT
ncbi:hypothetical protein CA13_62620 [Planctomycetes bacterium CA13]|uniref:Uncharacterized protein n=1 Tax=Novipirellula herctigrandis TaxID=2527986 RepID=A0A5C5ZBU2_9BACT|nr:hypothetical protein CA13_62620 [Planctomycetes bacterium CA13]